MQELVIYKIMFKNVRKKESFLIFQTLTKLAVLQKPDAIKTNTKIHMVTN